MTPTAGDRPVLEPVAEFQAPMSSSSFPDRGDLILGLLIAASVMTGAFPALPWWSSTLPLVAVACLAWFRSTECNILWFAALLAVAIPNNAMAIRLSIADLFMLPVIAREVRQWRYGPVNVRSTLTRPMLLLLAAFAMATLVGYLRIGRFTSWMLVSKDAGLLFLVIGCLAIIRYARSFQRIRRVAMWFAYGVSAANLVALLFVPVSLAGIENLVFNVSSRLLGPIGNPSAHGGLLIAAGMIEFGLLAAAPALGMRGALRYANLCCLGLGLGLTLSRSSWVALTAASGVLLVLLLMNRALQARRRPGFAMMLIAWFVLPAGFLSSILAVNVLAGMSLSPEDRAAELRAQFGDNTAPVAAAPSPAAPVASEPTIPAPATPAPATPAPATPPPVAPPSTAAAPAVSDAPPASAPQPEIASPPPDLNTAMMNARGLTDRLAILALAWDAYTADASSMIFGIGLGRFLATSRDRLGVPLIIHNTFAWFLIEFGPLGLIAVLWIWVQTARNLQIAAATDNDGRFLAYGALAALAGLTVFCVFNEGFYQRQLWLVFVLADRLRLLAASSLATADVVVSEQIGGRAAGVSWKPAAGSR